MPGLFAASGSMASCPRTLRPKPLNLSPLPLDRVVQFLVVAMLDQVGQDLQDPARAAVESQLSACQVTFTQASLDGRSFIDCPEAPQRKGGGHRPAYPCRIRVRIQYSNWAVTGFTGLARLASVRTWGERPDSGVAVSAVLIGGTS